MTVRRIIKKSLTRLNGISTVEVKESTTVLGIQELPNMEDPLQLLLVEEVPPTKVVQEEPKKTIQILLVNDQMPFSDPGENKALQYIGTVVWDNGYRVHHAFEVEDVPDFKQIMQHLGEEEQEFEKAVASVGLSEDDIEVGTDEVEEEIPVE